MPPMGKEQCDSWHTMFIPHLHASTDSPSRRMITDAMRGPLYLKEITMLVLRRTSGQRIVIAGTIRITVLKIQGSGVKLGIEAPPDLAILREEIIPSENGLHSATLIHSSDKSA